MSAIYRPSDPVVKVTEAFCMYELAQGAVAALRGLSLTVASGERVVIHGPNGSGKTTLLKLLVDEQSLSAGEARVAGWPVGSGRRRGADEWRARSVGWVDQFPARSLRPELSVVDNVAVQLRLSGDRRAEARQRAYDALDGLDVGHLATRDVAALSGGEAQRVAVAAAIVHRPTVVFADEPCGQLDAEAADLVYQALAKGVEGSGAALVLVSHDRRAERIADRVVHLRDGRTSEVWWPGNTDPTTAPDRLLMVDDRGWVRLPERMVRATGSAPAVQVRLEGDAIVLRNPTSDAGGREYRDTSMWARPAEVTQSSESLTSVEPGHLINQAKHSSAPRLTGAGPGLAPPKSTEIAADLEPPQATQGHRAALVVELREVSTAFDGRSVLRGVGFSAVAGSLNVIAGRSGSGKSTLLRILTGLERPDSGVVRVADVDLTSLDRSALAIHRRAHVGLLLQEVHLAETMTARENLSLARSARGLQPDDAADASWLQRLWVDHVADRRVNTCSGGERQRVALARALVSAPPVIVLDEPSSQLDETSTDRLGVLLRELANTGAAVIVATHDPLLVALADAVTDLSL